MIKNKGRSFYQHFKNVWSALQDDISKKLFLIGIEIKHSETLIPLYDYLMTCEQRTNNFITLLLLNKFHLNRNEVFIYGMRNRSTVLGIFKHYEITSKTIIDDDEDVNVPQLGITDVVSNIRKYISDKMMIVVPDNAHSRHEKKEKLIELGVPSESIVLLVDISSLQYFNSEIVAPSQREVFVDAGAFDGLTTVNFVKWCRGNYGKIFMLEPDEKNVLQCENTLKKHGIRNCTIFNKALWDSHTHLNFSHSNSPGSRVKANAPKKVETITIDGMLNGENATFIKYDVEGAELEALRGSRKTIMKYRPHLAISLYHKPSDIFDIPQYLLELVPDYKFYIRHYSTYSWEMVLHAC